MAAKPPLLFVAGLGAAWAVHHRTTWRVRPPRATSATAGFEADMGALAGRLDGIVVDMAVSCGRQRH